MSLDREIATRERDLAPPGRAGWADHPAERAKVCDDRDDGCHHGESTVDEVMGKILSKLGGSLGALLAAGAGPAPTT
jgi:hypothetical protein